MEPGYYKMVNGEMLYGTKISSPTYTLTSKDKDKPVDGWVWYDKPPVADIALPCGCVVKMLTATETDEAETKASIEALNEKIIGSTAIAKISNAEVIDGDVRTG